MNNKYPKPDYCTSSRCDDYGCDYCRECSHAIFFGSGKDVNGKMWKWEFAPYFGPLFLRKNGVPLKNQPGHEDHPAWEPFERWGERRFFYNDMRHMWE